MITQHRPVVSIHFFSNIFSKSNVIEQVRKKMAHQPLVLALLSENRRLAALEAENSDLVKCLEEYQSAMEMIMHQYRCHVTKFAVSHQTMSKEIAESCFRAEKEKTSSELRLLSQINDMTSVMQEACAMDDKYYTDVVGLVTR